MENAYEEARPVALSGSRNWICQFLGDPVLDHLAGDIGEPKVSSLETVGQPFVMDAEEM